MGFDCGQVDTPDNESADPEYFLPHSLHFPLKLFGNGATLHVQGETMQTLIERSLYTATGDITKTAADAVVNAANSSLLGGGGVDGAIHRAGGPSILDECREIRSSVYPDGLPAGQAVATTAGRLPADYVIHTVGPVWYGGNHGEAETLGNAYFNSLTLAAELNCRSMAFPNISTGVYRYPKPAAAKIALETVMQFLKKNQSDLTVILVCFSMKDEEHTHDIFKKMLQD